LPNLEYLQLERNQISDLSPLRALKKLTTLRLYHNEVKDLSPLKHLPLEELDLEQNKIEDLSDLVGIETLRNLKICFNPIKDASPLLKMPNLEFVCTDAKDIYLPLERYLGKSVIREVFRGQYPNFQEVDTYIFSKKE